MKRSRVLWTSLVILLILAQLPFAGPARAQGGGAIDRTGGPRERINLVLQADSAPQPGGSAQLVLSATPLIDAPDLQVQWLLPAGVQLQGADRDSFGPVSANQTVQSVRTLVFPSSGIYKVVVLAQFQLGPGVTFGASGVLFFIIAPNGSVVTDKDPDARPPARSGLPEQVTLSPLPLAASPNLPSSPNGDPCFTVSGHIDRLERPPTTSGYGTNVRVPLVGAAVEIREEDILFDDSYGTVHTDDSGNFSKSFCDDDGWFDDTLEIYYRLHAERGNPKVYVEDSSWIDEEYEYDSNVVSSDGGNISYNLNLDNTWSGLFNIVDAAYQARKFWVDSGHSYSEETEIHWEAGYGDDGSYFNPFWNEITIADDPSDPDQWDDSVIMHEWGHSADDYYSCDDNPGGDHYIDQLVDDPELAWGEGYPDYYQSAVRGALGDPFGSWYIDINGSGISGIEVDLEAYDTSVSSDLISTRNELAIAAALWDLNDNVNDGQDRVNHGHNMIQAVYTSNAFKDVAYGFWDDTCDFDTFMRGWVDDGRPTDGDTAAAVLQNTGYTLSSSMAKSAESPKAAASFNGPSAADVYRWWKQLTFVADNSASMAGPKFDAVKTLFGEAVNDLGNDPEGTEFSLELFNNTSSSNTPMFAGQFFPENLTGPINALVPSAAADSSCNVYALRALAQAIDDKEKGDVWLFTDGDTVQVPSVEAVRQQLNDRSLRASVALMGLCPALAKAALPAGPASLEQLQALDPDQAARLEEEQALSGQARLALGPAAADVPGGLVPYLLTAINSGGQFLYVDPSQTADAADILRAQITNSAGAGRWSDYVSDSATYRFDTLASWEYNWITATLGTNRGNPPSGGYMTVPLPQSFPYFSAGSYNKVNIFEDGYLTLGGNYDTQPNNTTLPNVSPPNNAIYPFWDNLAPSYIICSPQGNSPTACGTNGWIYTLQQGDWFVIEYFRYNSSTAYNNIFELLLNLADGEIRYQYQALPDGASSATIGLENAVGNSGVQVSYNDVNGASNGMGYKFTPAPPQPTKTYTVTVDSSMQSVGFLLTGYSGTFEPLAVTAPDGTPVNCSAQGTLCLNLDLVQYVQVNTNGRTGDWHAIVDAGSSGSGTFSFTSMAASPIAVESSFDHTLATEAQNLLVHFNGIADGGQLTAHFAGSDGSLFGGSFKFFDDGAHGDHLAGDGLFGSEPFTPPVAGSAFLWLAGHANGEQYLRVDPVPYSFQPVKLVSLGDGANFGGATQLPFRLTNYDSVDHCYWETSSAPEGWWFSFFFLPIVCANAGQTVDFTLSVYMGPGSTNTLPSGTTGIFNLAVTELEKGEISDAAGARVTRFREPATIEIFNPTYYLRPNGDTTTLDFFVVDAQNVRVSDVVSVTLSASTGVISPTVALPDGGFFRATYTSGPATGVALIKAETANGITATTEIDIGNPRPSQISLAAGAYNLPPDGKSTTKLTATVRDRWGTPMSGQTVRIGVEGDTQLGAIAGGDVITGTTDSKGQFSATFTAGQVFGVTAVRAELVYDKGDGPEVVLEDRKLISLLGKPVYLPFLVQP